MYSTERVSVPRRILRRVLPVRWGLHALAVLTLMLNVFRRGPVATWEIYRLSTGAWLDHLVSDRFFSREQLEQICQSVFPGCELRRRGKPGAVAVIWDAPGASHAAESRGAR